MGKFSHFKGYLHGLKAILNVPISESFDAGFIAKRLKDLWQTTDVWSLLTNETNDKTNFHDIPDMMYYFSKIPADTPWLAKQDAMAWNFQRDAVFAWQRVAGPNPISLRRINPDGSNLPGMNFPLLWAKANYTDSQFKNAVKCFDSQFNKTLDSEITDGRIYVVDYSIFQDAINGNQFGRQKYIRPVIGLFYSHPEDGLLPIGIHLNGSFVLPTDANWTVAKYAFQVADVTYHELCVHLPIAHLILDNFVNLTRGALHKSHPVRCLLEPHFQNVSMNNEIGRQLLLNDGGMIDELLPTSSEYSKNLWASSCKEFRLVQLDPHIEISERGCDDPTKLTFYPYRDDSFLLYEAMHDYVKSIIEDIYKNREIDREVSQWFKDISDFFSNEQRVGFGLSTVDDLINLITGIMFLSSGFHSAVNYPQWDQMMLVPFMPTALYADPTTSNNLMELLPPIERFIRQIEVLWILSGDRMDRISEIPILNGFSAQRDAYLDRLSQIETTLRGLNRPMPYTYLWPCNVTAAANL